MQIRVWKPLLVCYLSMSEASVMGNALIVRTDRDTLKRLWGGKMTTVRAPLCTVCFSCSLFLGDFVIRENTSPRGNVKGMVQNLLSEFECMVIGVLIYYLFDSAVAHSGVSSTQPSLNAPVVVYVFPLVLPFVLVLYFGDVLTCPVFCLPLQ